jgi:exonuclease III
VQSLNSKYESLKEYITELFSKNVNIEIIALQEIWQIQHINLVSIPGFHPLICSQRRGMRGGGVGFYIKNTINFVLIPELSPFNNKIIEATTLLLSHPNRSKFYVTSLYKSNGTIPNMTAAEQNTLFFENFNSLLESLSQKQHKSIIFTDSNIDLLHLNENATTYLNTILTNGFLQIQSKASRIDGNSSTLLDHIITNLSNRTFQTGILISDISDHFITFMFNGKNLKPPEQTHCLSRNFSLPNLNNFKTLLSQQDWSPVYNANEVDPYYDNFWEIYNRLYNNCFPLTRVKFNKNIHKKNNFMTLGLLTSRQTKLNLQKASIVNPTALNIQLYKNYRKIFQKTLRAAKKT